MRRADPAATGNWSADPTVFPARLPGPSSRRVSIPNYCHFFECFTWTLLSFSRRVEPCLCFPVSAQWRCSYRLWKAALTVGLVSCSFVTRHPRAGIFSHVFCFHAAIPRRNPSSELWTLFQSSFSITSQSSLSSTWSHRCSYWPFGDAPDAIASTRRRCPPSNGQNGGATDSGPVNTHIIL